MLIVPAIDIRGGKCVRLLRGDYARETVFGDDPAAMARRWIEDGARALHLVDLDGARSGRSDNESAVKAILREVESARGATSWEDASSRHAHPSPRAAIVTELGGGIRDLPAVARWLDAGLDRVIVGTAAVKDPALVSRAAEKFPGRVWVGIDARGGKVAVSGWTEATALDALEFARDMAARGAAGIIYTDIDRDGTREGVNADATARIAAAVGVPVFASGGVSTVEDVERLRAAAGVKRTGMITGAIAGVIVGRALYDGAVTLAELQSAAAGGS